MDAKVGRGRRRELAEIPGWKPQAGLTWLRGLRQASGAHGQRLLDRVLGRFQPSSRMQSKVKNDRTG